MLKSDLIIILKNNLHLFKYACWRHKHIYGRVKRLWWSFVETSVRILNTSLEACNLLGQSNELLCTAAYSKPRQTSKMELFVKTIYAERSTLDVHWSSEYASKNQITAKSLRLQAGHVTKNFFFFSRTFWSVTFVK